MLGFKCYDIEMTWWASTPLLHNTKCTQRAPCIYATALCLCTLSHTGEVSPTLRGAWQAMQLLSRTYLYASFGNKINERRNTSPSLQVWLPIRTCFYWLQAASKPYYTDSPIYASSWKVFSNKQDTLYRQGPLFMLVSIIRRLYPYWPHYPVHMKWNRYAIHFRVFAKPLKTHNSRQNGLAHDTQANNYVSKESR